MAHHWLSRLAAAAALGALLSPGEAAACGGTFCDVGPTAMPVDQTGENILFVMNDNIVEAHVQIQYQGDPERFAWIVPMQRVPDVTVGSQALFDQLLDATVPRYGFSTERDQCGEEGTFLSGRGESAAFDGDAAFGNGGVTVHFEKTVGAFEVTALSGSSAEEVIDWLEENGYEQIDTAPDILRRYVERSFVFVALKMTAGAGIDEIHPLVFSYEGDEPCVPLELTAVAAIDDMAVRTFFLGAHRVVPTTYRHVLVNPLKIDWLNFGANYNDVISRAVDVDHADGQAFVTEYAGPSSIVPGGLANPAWDAARLAEATAELLLDELARQNLVFCTNDFCEYRHPLIEPILTAHLPAPIGVTDEAFYSCVSCFADQADLDAFDGAAFAAAVEERVFAPARHADALVRDNPYLTRLFTLISPHEMLYDPMFREEPDLPEVPLPGLATQRIRCDGAIIFTLPDGEQVALGREPVWPAFDDMPDALAVESYDALPGQMTVLADFRAEVGDQIATHNERHGLGRSSGCGCRVGTRGGGALSLWLGLGLVIAGLSRRRGAGRASETPT